MEKSLVNPYCIHDRIIMSDYEWRILATANHTRSSPFFGVGGFVEELFNEKKFVFLVGIVFVATDRRNQFCLLLQKPA